MVNIWNFNRKQLEVIVTKIGFTDLKWCPADQLWWGEDIRSILYARPKNYNGPYEGYIEPVAIEKVKKFNIHLGYKWVKKVKKMIN